MLHKHNSGFTLIELLVTVVVAAVLLTIAVPSFKDMIERGRVKALAEAIYEDMQFARSEALKMAQGTNNGVTISFDAANGCWGIVSGMASCDCTTPGSCSVKVTTVADNFPAVEISAVDLADRGDGVSRSITIDSMQGRAFASTGVGPGKITLRNTSNNAKKLQAQVSPLGRILLCVPDGGEAILGYDSCGDGL